MPEELYTASSLLRTALDRYIAACSMLRNGCSHKNGANNLAELSGIVANELGLVESYKSKLGQAQAAMRQARNELANIPPIYTLPDEVLTYTFHLVLAAQPCPLHVHHIWNSKIPPRLPAYPDTLAHVCSRWRQIALGSHGLWAHIDIALSCPLSHQFHNRAVAYVARAHQAPLDIHFIDPGCILLEDLVSSDSTEELPPKEWNDLVYHHNPKEFTFLASSPASQVRSLGLLACYYYHPIHNRVLEHSLTNCLPGGLSELVITAPRWFPLSPNFIRSGASPEDVDPTDLIIPEQQLEHAWRSTTVLKLKGRYPCWTSAAYHGLTDLRLLGHQKISESELAGILKSSPKLKTIHCDFTISDSPSSTTLPIPTNLPELETLRLDTDFASIERFPKLLKPSLNPLQFSLRGNPTPTRLQAFFARSNVQELYVGSVWGDFPMLPPEAFCLPPQLRVLVMINWDWRIIPKHEVATPVQLDTVFILKCNFNNAQRFRKAVAHFSPRRLVLWRCSIGTSWTQTSLAVFKSVLGEDLGQICTLEYINNQDPNPVQDWD